MQGIRRLAGAVALASSLAFAPAALAAPNSCLGELTETGQFGDRPATIVGTDGDDVIVGTSGPDVIDARGGNDIVRGGAGDDFVCGGPGDDFVHGEEGNDGVDGVNDDVLVNFFTLGLPSGDGPDDVRGGPGDDIVFGFEGDDRLRGNAGNDSLVAETGSDWASGGAGDDTIDGSPFDIEQPTVQLDPDSRDTLYGDAGDDVITDIGGGDDHLAGGSGEDYLFGGFGDDLLRGELDDDLLGLSFPAAISPPPPLGFPTFLEEGDDDLRGSNGDDELDGGPGTNRANGGSGDDACVNAAIQRNCERDELTPLVPARRAVGRYRGSRRAFGRLGF